MTDRDDTKDVFCLIGSRKGICIENCLAKLDMFCKYDAYPKYDRAGYEHLDEYDRFQRVLLTVTNGQMMARTSRKAWEPFLERPLPFLAELPRHVDLVESSDEDYQNARQKLHNCYIAITTVSGITDMAASKMLYLKRPRLVAISDSYVREALDILKPSIRSDPRNAAFYTAQALSVSDAVRATGKYNFNSLEYFQKKLSPLEISKARIVDILIWVDKAIRNGNIHWSKWAKEKGWSSIAR